jgi:hypothetical protein
MAMVVLAVVWPSEEGGEAESPLTIQVDDSIDISPCRNFREDVYYSLAMPLSPQ